MTYKLTTASLPAAKAYIVASHGAARGAEIVRDLKPGPVTGEYTLETFRLKREALQAEKFAIAVSQRNDFNVY
jgi:hypothetical protein